MKEKVGGRLSEALETLRALDQLSLSELAAAGRAGKDALVAKYGLLPAQAEKLAQAPESVWMEVEELDLPATTTIELNTAPEGEDAVWQKLDCCFSRSSTAQFPRSSPGLTRRVLTLRRPVDSSVMVEQSRNAEGPSAG